MCEGMAMEVGEVGRDSSLEGSEGGRGARYPWPGHRAAPRADHRLGWEHIGPAWGPLTHLGNPDNVRLLDEPGRLVIGIGHQDHDFFCHLRRGRGKRDRSWSSETFQMMKGQWLLMPPSICF